MKYNKNDTEICITAETTEIADKQFQGFVKLERVTFLGDVIGERAFAGCTELAEVNLLLQRKLNRICSGAFSGCRKLETISACTGVYTVEANAFEGCVRLKEINLTCVTQIGNGAFMGCERLERITLGGSLKKIGARAFAGCDSLKSFEIPDGTAFIGDRAFEGCRGLDSIYIPASVTHIGEKAFAYHKNFVILCDKGSFAEQYAKENDIVCKLNKASDVSAVKTSPRAQGVKRDSKEVFRIDKGTAFIKNNEYRGNTATDIVIPGSVMYIGRSAFFGCNFLRSVIIEGGVMMIGEKAFGGCEKLARVRIPNTVTSIDDNAFQGCRKDLVVECARGSEAEKYAKRYGYAVKYR